MHNGNGFDEILINESFDKCYGFEPIPEVYENLKRKYINNPKIELINAAVVQNEAIYDFFITKKSNNSEYTASSALFELTDEYRINSGNDIVTKEKISVQGINIASFLNERGIEYIEKYVSDAEGNDFTILSTLKTFIQEKRIRNIQVESECDYISYVTRKQQPPNKERNFVNLLGDNYELYDKQSGNYDPDSKNRWAHRDLFFRLKPEYI